jgi:O-succinylbenzoate synthase
MAKLALETAILDAQLRDEKRSFASYHGATQNRVECGVSVGIVNNLDSLVEEVKSYVDAGYRRIKLKIEPAWNIEVAKTIREIWPEMPL